MRTSLSNNPVVAITLGDVSGVGPEITYRALLDKSLRSKAAFVVVGDLDVIRHLKKRIKRDLKLNTAGAGNCSFIKGAVNLIDLSNISSSDYKIGFPNKHTALASKQYIDEAVRLAKSGKVDCIVTSPIHKESMNRVGFKFPGHTEYIAYLCGIENNFAMMMASERLKAILITTHVPLKDVPRLIKEGVVLEKIKLAHIFLKSYFGIDKPRIALCALNPHSGEGGIFGLEEKRILLPASNAARRAGIDITPPLASDSLFAKIYRGDYDAAICMYHDQAMIPIKMFGLNNTVNITLGLPFIRTSPAHGTAHDIADKFTADESSMRSAIELAIDMYKNRLRGSFEN